MNQTIIKRLRHFLYTQITDADKKELPSLKLAYEETYKQFNRVINQEGGVHPLYPERILDQLTAWLIDHSTKAKMTMEATSDASIHSRNYWYKQAYQTTLQWIQGGGR